MVALTDLEPRAPTTPLFWMRFVTLNVLVVGPVMTKVMKSSLSYDSKGYFLTNLKLACVPDVSHTYLADVTVARTNGGSACACHEVFTDKVGAILAGHPAAAEAH